MALNTLFRPMTISGSALDAERLRMEVTANNIANAYSTRSPGGGPYRRQDVVFAAVLGGQLAGDGVAGGVRADEVVDDPSPFPVVHMPGHPDADAEGYLRLPNVDLPMEMVNLVTASRAYEANVRAGQTFVQMSQQALSLLRG